MRRAGALLLGWLLLAPAAQAAVPAEFVHAHRGGAYVNGVPAYPEASMKAFKASAKRGFVLELDTKLTSDRIVAVMHDPTLDRTTNCTGEVAALAWADLSSRCRIDVLGSPGSGLPSKPAPRPQPVPRLEEVLALAKARGVTLNIEIKNAPTDSDFDSTPAFAQTVMAAIVASGIPQDQVIVQSFWPPDLQTAKAAWPGVTTSLLTLAEFDPLGTAGATLLGHAWWSPSWPVTATDVQLAHALGRKVVPYTINDAAGVAAAGAAGVDAVISDDPVMALGALR